MLMSNGRIVADGNKAEVLQSDTVSTVFGLPVEITRRDGYYRLW